MLLSAGTLQELSKRLTKCLNPKFFHLSENYFIIFLQINLHFIILYCIFALQLNHNNRTNVLNRKLKNEQ